MLRTFITRSALVLLALVLAEALLQVAALADGRLALLLSPGIERMVLDERLARRPNPAVPEHDDAGWRNPVALERAAIVALGDSQTYGDEVSRRNAWPLRLGRSLGVPAYNMGMSGFGPVEYYLLGAEALEKRPRVLVVGIYSGNDMVDAFEEAVEGPRAPELLAGLPLTRDELLRRNAELEPLGSAWRMARAARRGRWKALRDAYLEPIAETSKLWGVARALERLGSDEPLGVRGDTVRVDFDSYTRRVASLPRDDYFPVRGPNAATVLTPRGRGAVMNRADPRVDAGARITLRAMAGLRELCGDDCRVLAVMIPTKELAYEDEVAASGAEVPEAYRALLTSEKELRRFLRAGLEAEGIATFDPLPALRASIAAGRNPYLSDWDGHPNIAGNQVIADELRRHPLLEALREN